MRLPATGLRATVHCAPSSKPATIAAGTDSYVVMKSGNSLDVEIENARSSPSTDENLTTGSCTVAKTDTDRVRMYFADISAGKVRVTE